MSLEKDLAAFASECDRLETRIRRQSFLRLTLFVLFVFFLASAFQTTNSKNASGIAARIRTLSDSTDALPDLDGFLTTVYFARSPHTSRISLDEQTQDTTTSSRIARERGEEANLGNQLSRIVDQAFAIDLKAPLLGTDLKLDLRIWGFVLPLCLICWEVYLSILRHKLHILQRLVAAAVQKAPDLGTTLDALQFGEVGRNRSQWLRHPAQFEVIVSVLAGISLITYLGIEAATFLRGTSRETTLQFVEAYAFVLIYAICYGEYAKRQINALAQEVGGLSPRRPAWQLRIETVLRRIRARVKPAPELSLGSGCLLVLTTLWLLVGSDLGCNSSTGWEYIHHPSGWLVGPITGIGAQGGKHNLIIAVLYGAGLVLGAATVILLLSSLARRQRLRQGRSTHVLAVLATILVLYFVTELTFGQFLDLSPYAIAVSLLWLVPMWLWWRYTRAGPLRERWPHVRVALARWYTPQVLVAMVITVGTLFERPRLIGVPVLICGLTLLSLGYWNAYDRSP